MIKDGARNLTLNECVVFNENFGITLAVNNGKDVQVDIEPGVYVNLLGVLVVD